jgi:hypothetical protein
LFFFEKHINRIVHQEKNHPNRRGPGRIWQKWKRGNEKVAERKEINRREE